MESVIIELTKKTKRKELNWQPLNTFDHFERLHRELDELYSLEPDYEFKKIWNEGSFFLTHNEGYIALCNVCIIDRKTHVESDKLLFLTKPNLYVPIESSIRYPSLRKKTALLKSAIEFNIYEEYSLPEVYYNFWSDIIEQNS